MVRIGISVEGPTEERFVKQVLAPYLANKNIFITPIHMEGDVKLDKVKNELKNIANSFDYVTTLYDFYGFKKKAPDETKKSLEEKILQHAHPSIRPRLIPYIQMYEFEGLLFSDPDAMESELEEEGVKNWAESILNSFNNNPEAINDSTETAPSKRLAKKTSYRKTTHGPNIAEAIGLEKIREKCAGFNAWLQKIEALDL